MAKKKIAVLGGGPMGLSVAYQLARLPDIEVEIFEAGDRLGGMSVAFDFGGLEIERFYHFICKPDKPLFKVLRELGIEHKLHWTDTRMGYYYAGELYEWGNPIALLKFPHLGMLTKIRYGLMAFISTKRNDWSQLDKIDAVTWITRWIGKKGYDVLWKKLFELKFYGFTDNLSAAWIWTRIKRVGNSRKNLMQESLGYLEGGSETILKAFETALLKFGGKINLNARVERIVVENNIVSGIETQGKFRPFDAVVSTIPLPYVPKLMDGLDEDLRKKFEAVDNIAVICVIVKLDRALTPYFWLNVADDRMDIPGLVEYSNLNPIDDHVVYVPYYMPADNPMYTDADEEFERKVRIYLKAINPELCDDDIKDIVVSRYRYAQPICPPGFLDSIPPIELPVRGAFVADTSYYYPEDRGISESVDLGERIARQVLEQLSSR